MLSRIKLLMSLTLQTKASWLQFKGAQLKILTLQSKLQDRPSKEDLGQEWIHMIDPDAFLNWPI